MTGGGVSGSGGLTTRRWRSASPGIVPSLGEEPSEVTFDLCGGPAYGTE